MRVTIGANCGHLTFTIFSEIMCKAVFRFLYKHTIYESVNGIGTTSKTSLLVLHSHCYGHTRNDEQRSAPCDNVINQ